MFTFLILIAVLAVIIFAIAVYRQGWKIAAAAFMALGASLMTAFSDWWTVLFPGVTP